jgi:hypothetical protein
MTITPPTAADLAASEWRTSSYSAANNDCVEIARGGGWVGVRDTKDRTRGTIVLPSGAFAALLTAVQDNAL